MVIPALVAASDDPALRGAPLAVYVWMLANLDLHEPRTVKADALAHTLGMRPHTVGRAFRVLVARGYVAETSRQGRIRRFRLYLSRNVANCPPNARSAA